MSGSQSVQVVHFSSAFYTEQCQTQIDNDWFHEPQKQRTTMTTLDPNERKPIDEQHTGK